MPGTVGRSCVGSDQESAKGNQLALLLCVLQTRLHLLAQLALRIQKFQIQMRIDIALKVYEEKEAKEAGEKAEAEKKEEAESTERDAGTEIYTNDDDDDNFNSTCSISLHKQIKPQKLPLLSLVSPLSLVCHWFLEHKCYS
jgi:hypothetical protein